MTPTHRCSRCHEAKPLEAFRLDSAGRTRSHCIPCSRAVNQEWRARHRDELAARRRAAYAADPDALRAKARAWYAAHREERRAAASDPAYLARRRAAYREAHPQT